MTIEILKKNKINIFGIVLNNIKNKIEGDNHAKSIEQYGNVKVLEKISFFKDLNKKKIISLSKKTSFNVFKL